MRSITNLFGKKSLCIRNATRINSLGNNQPSKESFINRMLKRLNDESICVRWHRQTTHALHDNRTDDRAAGPLSCITHIHIYATIHPTISDIRMCSVCMCEVEFNTIRCYFVIKCNNTLWNTVICDRSSIGYDYCAECT